MHFAQSAEEALGKLDGGIQPQPMAILSDINMPGMDGLTLLGEIKRRWPDLTVVMVTAYAVYYNQVRPHLALAKDSPLLRPIQRFGKVNARPILGGLHHEYCRT
jgi:CheY-like chemotaxis protein